MDCKQFEETIMAAQNGDETALESLYLEYVKKVYYLALKLTHNKEDAEDITQEVFITVYQKIGEFKEPKTFPAWLNRITSNKCTDFLRKRREVLSIDEEEISGMEVFEESDPLLIPEKYVDNAETSRLITEIIDNLPLPQRVCIYYYYYEQLTIAQIAENLTTNENAVRRRIYLAREKIRKELERLNKEEGIKLYGVTPLLLTPLLKSPLQDFEMPSVAELWNSITANVATAAAETAVTAAVTSTVSATSATMAETGLVMALKTKIVIACAGLLLVGGIATTVILSLNLGGDPVVQKLTNYASNIMDEGKTPSIADVPGMAQDVFDIVNSDEVNISEGGWGERTGLATAETSYIFVEGVKISCGMSLKEIHDILSPLGYTFTKHEIEVDILKEIRETELHKGWFDNEVEGLHYTRNTLIAKKGGATVFTIGVVSGFTFAESAGSGPNITLRNSEIVGDLLVYALSVSGYKHPDPSSILFLDGMMLDISLEDFKRSMSEPCQPYMSFGEDSGTYIWGSDQSWGKYTLKFTFNMPGRSQNPEQFLSSVWINVPVNQMEEVRALVQQ